MDNVKMSGTGQDASLMPSTVLSGLERDIRQLRNELESRVNMASGLYSRLAGHDCDLDPVAALECVVSEGYIPQMQDELARARQHSARLDHVLNALTEYV